MNIPNLQIGRGNSLIHVMELLHSRSKSPVTIVEVGTSRGKYGGGPEGDGWSTIIFGWYCHTYGGTVYTIDIDKHCIAECKRLTEQYSDVIEYVNADANEYLETFTKQIDLLYLDGSDDPTEMYNQFKSVEHLLLDGSIILLDDIPANYSEFGKGRILVPHLFDNEDNFKFLYHDTGERVNQICFSYHSGRGTVDTEN